jgi:hypothetical protein
MEVIFALNVVLKFSLRSFNPSSSGFCSRMRANPALFINTISLSQYLVLERWEKEREGDEPSNLPYSTRQ